MEITGRSKWPLRLATLAVFALGFIAGVLALNLYHSRHYPFAGRFGRTPFFMFKSITERLALTPQQEKEVEKIFDEARGQLTELRRQAEPNIGEIRRQTEKRLKQVLTPEQWQRFQQMKKEMRERGGWYRERR
jgi:Spy/CpxP family protein refolding chaperone